MLSGNWVPEAQMIAWEINLFCGGFSSRPVCLYYLKILNLLKDVSIGFKT